MDALERLKPLCYQGDELPALTRPFEMKYEGRRWATATNGHALAAVPFDGELPADGPDAAGSILVPAPAPTHAVRLSAIREWAGWPYPKEDVCPKCKGTPPRAPYMGQDERGRYCGGCDSLGRITERHRGGLLLGGGLDRLLLAKVLATVPEGVKVLRVGQENPLTPYIFRCEGWIAAVMPMNGIRPETTRLEVAPLPPPAPSTPEEK